MSKPSAKLVGFGALVFVTSALVLVIELLAARLIAPFVGVSLYSWTAIIGVILAGLSLGNWVGGVWADRGGTERAVGVTLFLAGLSALAILLILPLLGGPLQAARFSLATTSVILALALFFTPAALLGVITPLLTTLALAGSNRPGHVVGLMHALAALGSIAGTFATGFYLVQWFGSRQLILVTGVLLALMALPLLRRGGPTVAAIIVGTGAAVASHTLGYASPCDRETSYFCIRVVDSSEQAPSGEARSMVLDHLLHSTNHRQDPGLLLAPYLHLMDEMIRRQVDGREDAAYFFAGGGAYTLPRAVKTREPGARVVVAELDPAVTEVAVAQLYLDAADMEIHHLDARAALHRHGRSAFDVVVGDVFHDIAIPYHLLTREFAQAIEARLSPDGLYVMNVVDAFPDARLVKSVHKTLSAVFDDVDIWIDELPRDPTRLTYVLSAHHRGPAFPDRLHARQGIRRMWYRVTEPVLAVGTPMADVPVLTDDHAPVERLLARLFLGREGL